MNNRTIRSRKQRLPASPRQTQRGSVLLISLILMVAATLLTVAEMKSSMMQEKMTSNQYAKENARMAAEEGAALARAWLTTLKNEDDWDTWIDAAADESPWYANSTAVEASDERVNESHNQGKNQGNGNYKRIRSSNSSEKGSVYWIDPNEIQKSGDFALITVHGAVNDDSSNQLAEAAVIVRAKEPTVGGTTSPFDGLVACDDLTMSGSGQIDSFDSRLGVYGGFFDNDEGIQEQNSLRTNVIVRTISDTATSDLSGNSPIYGELRFTGQELKMSGSSPIYGDVYAEGNISMDGTMGDLDGDGSIDGTLNAGGSISFGTASTSGEVFAGGNVSIDATGNPPTAISAAGAVSWPGWWKWDADKQALTTNYKGNDGTKVDSIYDSSEQCDELGIRDDNGNAGEKFTDAKNTASPLSSFMPDTDEDGSEGPDYTVSGNNDTGYTLSGPGTEGNSLDLGSSEDPTIIHVDGDLSADGELAAISITGDVTIVVDGDFNLGDNTQLNVQADSTLTLLVEGKTNLSAGTNLTSNDFVRTDDDGNVTPAVQLFSAYESTDKNDTGVTISGAHQANIAIYAPYAATSVAASGGFSGSIRTKYLNISGSGDIHYDEALGTITEPSTETGKTTTGTVAAWFETK